MRRLLAACLIVAGCSFPEPTVIDLDGAVADTGRAESGGIDASDAPVDDTGAEDTSPGDTGPLPDTTGGDTTDPCDKDGDGFKAAGGSCPGMDCDDNDKFANPGVMTHQTLSIAGKPHKGDWNCNGTIEKLHAINRTCPLTGGAGCDATKGFQGDPECGKSGNYLTCKTNGLGCEGTVNTTMTIVQACK